MVFVSPCRAVCETRALKFGRRLLTEQFPDVKSVVQSAENQRHDGSKPFFELKLSGSDRVGFPSGVTDVEP